MAAESGRWGRGAVDDQFGFVCRVVGVIVFGFSFICAFTPLPLWIAQSLVPEGRRHVADAVVVLGGGMRIDGELSEASIRRAVKGFVAYGEGRTPLLVMSGPGLADGHSEAEARARLAESLGFPQVNVLLETRARTTREEAMHVGKILRSRGVKTILLVTGGFHLLRAVPLFEREGFRVAPLLSGENDLGANSPAARILLVRQMLRELVAQIYYRIAGYL